MGERIFFSVTMTLIQLVAAYLRYLPFKKGLSAKEISTLWRDFFIWASIATVIYIFFLQTGINLTNYKIIAFLGWIPYIIISVLVIKNTFFHHIFVAGMVSLWSFMLHSISSMIILVKEKMTDENVIWISTIYFLLFILMLPIEKKIFSNILPSDQFFETKQLRYFVALLPLVILFGTVTPIINVTFFQTWIEKFSRLIVLLFFFMSYRWLFVSMKQMEQREREEKARKIAQQQIMSLNEQIFFMNEGRQEFERLQDDLTRKYTYLDNLLDQGKISESMQFILNQEKLLDKTSIKRFCDAPLINAALSIYLRRAQVIGVHVTQKINVPKDFSTNEIDMAILISNLLENAVQASAKQKENRREISIIFQHKGEQCVLEISNRYDFPLQFGENNLPCTENEGHGFGMHSVEKFINKYDAYVDFSQKNNLVKFQMYWEDSPGKSLAFG